MIQIKCGDAFLYDHRDPSLIVANPKVKVEVNTVGGATFTIYHNHPNYNKLHPLKPLFEFRDEYGVFFRGRMTKRSLDFYNSKAVDLEGAMAFFNDSIVRPFVFPDDFLNDTEYQTAENVVEFFLKWLIDNHNSQVEEFQRFKLGKVTVADPNNYISRSSEKIDKTWNVIKSKLFDSTLGGYFCIRYEDDGNYIDYVSEFELTNTQPIKYGKNLSDLKDDSDSSEIFTAMIPTGADGITIASLEDADVTPDIVKQGDIIYSKSGIEQYGWIYADPDDSTWSDVTEPANLLNKSVDKLSGDGLSADDTIEFKAVDLHYSDSQIQSFRVCRNVKTVSKIHGHNTIYPLTKLDMDLFNPQNTVITVGATKRSFTAESSKNQVNTNERIDAAEKDIEQNRNSVSAVQEEIVIQTTKVFNDCEQVILGALKEYTKTSNFEEFKKTVEAELLVIAGEILMNFNTTTEQISNVDGDLQSKFTQIYKYISFSTNGIKIGTGDNAMSLTLDNGMIAFQKNGVTFGWWDGVDFNTGNIIIKVNEKAQFGNFAYIPRTDGSLSFLKVSG